MIKIILCADDYAQNQSVTDGILQLLQARRLSAVSCLTTTDHWSQHAKLIMPFHNHVDIGLHFNLTDGNSLTGIDFESLPHLLIKSFLKKMVLTTIVDELNAQLDHFTQHTGITPDYIDGHQHVHHFPIIRDALLSVYQKRFPKEKPYFRVTINYHSPKAFIISLTGATILKKMAKAHGIPHNTTFSGIYNFHDSKNYGHLFLKFIHQSSTGGIIMCHPGLTSNDPKDPLAQSRVSEFNYLMSNQFLNDCQANKIVLSKFNEIGSI